MEADADEKQIRRAFRRLAARHHPDSAAAPASGDFAATSAAYTRLLEIVRLINELPDIDLDDDLDEVHDDDDSIDADDLIWSRPGAHAWAEITISLELALLGGPLAVNHHGRSVTVEIPPQISEGVTLRLAGMGAPGSPPGDLHLKVRVLEDPRWRVEGPDLVADLVVTWLAAYRGDWALVLTPWGLRGVSLPAGAAHGHRLLIPAVAGRLVGGRFVVHLLHRAPPPGDRLLEEALERAYET